MKKLFMTCVVSLILGLSSFAFAQLHTESLYSNSEVLFLGSTAYYTYNTSPYHTTEDRLGYLAEILTHEGIKEFHIYVKSRSDGSRDPDLNRIFVDATYCNKIIYNTDIKVYVHVAGTVNSEGILFLSLLHKATRVASDNTSFKFSPLVVRDRYSCEKQSETTEIEHRFYKAVTSGTLFEEGPLKSRVSGGVKISAQIAVNFGLIDKIE